MPNFYFKICVFYYRSKSVVSLKAEFSDSLLPSGGDETRVVTLQVINCGNSYNIDFLGWSGKSSCPDDQTFIFGYWIIYGNDYIILQARRVFKVENFLVGSERQAHFRVYNKIFHLGPNGATNWGH